MEIKTSDQLTGQKCVPCEGNVEPYTPSQTADQLAKLQGWHLTYDGKRIRKEWHVKDFMAGIDFFGQVARLAEDEGHHPDLHIEGYRHVWIEIWTHAVGGLSENDFILAAKIDILPVELG